MRRILATVLLTLSAVIGLPAAAHAGGPTSVLITQPGVSAGALYFNDEAYDALLGLLPSEETRGTSEPPAGGVDYNLTWMIHDVEPWRFDRVRVAQDGKAWASTTLSTDSSDSSGGWAPVDDPKGLAGILTGVLAEGGSPEVVSLAPEVTEPSAAPATPDETGSSWFSLTGWRWVVPGVLLGLLAGVVTARRNVDREPRQVLLTSDS
jgi:hypothetical protein